MERALVLLLVGLLCLFQMDTSHALQLRSHSHKEYSPAKIASMVEKAIKKEKAESKKGQDPGEDPPLPDPIPPAPLPGQPIPQHSDISPILPPHGVRVEPPADSSEPAYHPQIIKPKDPHASNSNASANATATATASTSAGGGSGSGCDESKVKELEAEVKRLKDELNKKPETDCGKTQRLAKEALAAAEAAEKAAQGASEALKKKRQHHHHRRGS